MLKNRLYNIIAILLLLLFNNGACNDSNGVDDPDIVTPPNDYLGVTLKPDIVYQIIHGFGASDAWSTQFVGKNWPLAKKNLIADYLFSTTTDAQGNPKGIGLNTWRFNIGAGSSTQGGSSGINDSWRRAESFFNGADYDWNAQEGQRWFLNAAKSRGVEQFVAFSNSPPIALTKNGNAYSSGGSSANLEPSNYHSYADFLVNVLDHFKKNEGVDFDYVSPFNEPQWDWKGGQEGSPWQNSEIAEITRILDQKIQNQNLDTKIEITESGKLNYLYENADKSGRASHIQEFFDSGSDNYVGDLNSVAHKIAGHSYYTTYGTSTLVDTRRKVHDKIQDIDINLEFWMSEYCLLEDNSEMKGNGRDLGIDPALYLARVVHTDLTVANASSWQWWLALSPYDYKDGLVYIDNNKSDGEVFDSKLLWSLGNFSFFIKEGYQRIELYRSDNKSIEQSIDGLLVSAYSSPNNSKYVTVFVNQRSIEIPVKIQIDGMTNYTGNVYQTSALKTDNLAKKSAITGASILKIPARSIVTVVID